MQSGADQQHDRERDSRYDEALAEAAVADAAADLTRTVLQRFLHVGARAFERRREAADDGGERATRPP